MVVFNVGRGGVPQGRPVAGQLSAGLTHLTRLQSSEEAQGQMRSSDESTGRSVICGEDGFACWETADPSWSECELQGSKTLAMAA